MVNLRPLMESLDGEALAKGVVGVGAKLFDEVRSLITGRAAATESGAETLAGGGIKAADKAGPLSPYRQDGYPSNLLDRAKSLANGAVKDPDNAALFAPGQQDGFWWRSGPSLSLRTAHFPTITHSEKLSEPEIIFGKNGVENIRFPARYPEPDKTETMLAAGYAGLIRTNALAAREAGAVERRLFGVIPTFTERVATPAERDQNAIFGAKAYVRGETGNRFTEHLQERFGVQPTPTSKLAEAIRAAQRGEVQPPSTGSTIDTVMTAGIDHQKRLNLSTHYPLGDGPSGAGPLSPLHKFSWLVDDSKLREVVRKANFHISD